MTLMGLCSEVRRVRASELLDYTNYTGDYEFEMGIGKPPEYRPLLEHRDILVMSWGATVPMIAHAAGITLDRCPIPFDPASSVNCTPSISQETAFRFTDGSGRDAAAAGCLATGLRALNAVPAVNDLPPGWVTALDLPLIPGAGTIR